MSKVGYARVSSKSQNLARQIEKLKDYGADYIYTEKESGAEIDNRPKLQEMLDFIRVDDVVVISELDRLSRKADDITKIIDIIRQKGATLEVLSLPSTQGIENKNLKKLINSLILEIFKYQAEAERQVVKERQMQGIKAAQERGVYTGRKKMYRKDNPQLLHAFSLIDQGESIRQASKKTGINHETLRRYNKNRKNQA